MGKRDLSAELVAALHRVHGTHAGYRAVHAKGLCCEGSFRATPAAARLTRAAHFQGQTVAVKVRFSNGSGNPNSPDFAGDARAMAVKFLLPNDVATDILANSMPAFWTGDPQAFLEMIESQTPDPATGKPDPARFQEWAQRHPESRVALEAVKAAAGRVAASRAQAVYNALHAFGMVDSEGNRTWVRYQWRPAARAATISTEEARARGADFLAAELAQRLANGPVVFALHLQLAGPDDDTTDPSRPWPADRTWVDAGRLQISAILPGGCADDVFDPMRLVDGIEPSQDRILLARPGAYSVSIEERLGARPKKDSRLVVEAPPAI